MIHVYHYSEEPGITAFAARPSRLGEPFVWAIDAWRQPLYWLPRDCPRVCFWPDEGRTSAPPTMSAGGLALRAAW